MLRDPLAPPNVTGIYSHAPRSNSNNSIIIIIMVGSLSYLLSAIVDVVVVTDVICCEFLIESMHVYR